MCQMSSESLEESKQAETPEETLHSLRKSIDALIKWTEELKQNRESGYGREVALVHTKLQESKMWAGKCLEAIGTPFPKELRDEAED